VTPLVGVHVAAGTVSLVAGFVAMAATKGGRTHRLAGKMFVGAMTVMGLLGSAMAAALLERVSVIAGLLAAYLVGTAMLAVGRDVAHARRWLVGYMTVALVVGATGLFLGMVASGAPRGLLDGMPAAIYFVFGSVALGGGLADARVLFAGAPRGPARLVRHAWRMGFAMFIATGSFFLGQADEFPAALRTPVVMFGPVLLALGHTLFWLVKLQMQRWRGRGRGSDALAAGVRKASPL
jgi:hypothetical protein